jgi:cyclophilin family peptidyl-prolyl cis-trans isomerase
MTKLLTAILCLASFVSAQTTASSTSAQHANTEKAAQAATQTTADIETSMGTIHCVLFPSKAPQSVANFIGLATGTKAWKDPKTGKMEKGVPLYNGTIFHRVIPDFMIQGGDPAGTGSGDPGFTVKDETSPDLKFDQPGRLAYANAGPNTNGSQFFITEVPYPSLDGHYSIFGQCQDIELVKKIARVSRNSNDRPYDPPKIIRIKITEPKSASAAGTAKKSTPAKSK